VSSKIDWRRYVVWLGFLGALQFFVLSTLAMRYYPGGTLHDRGTEGYSFLYNYFSDLGRTMSWSGELNTWSNLFFGNSLTLAGVCLTIFFVGLPTLFKTDEGRLFAVPAALAGVVAALCYIGIAQTPLDVNYFRHTLFVRAGFIAFLGMSVAYGLAISNEPRYPNRYAGAFLAFGALLAIQITIMIFGPRSWTSPHALFLQASAQKVVVYAELLCMSYQCLGALRVLGAQGGDRVTG